MKDLSRASWLKELAALSPSVNKLLATLELPDLDYKALSSRTVNFTDAYNFAGSKPHNISLARCFDSLDKTGCSSALLTKFLTDLTGGRLTAGTLSELLVYDWLAQNGIPFQPQVRVTGRDILNPKGSDLDGNLRISSDVYFDIKCFGFQEVMIERLCKRLMADIPNCRIAVESSWDVPVETLQDLLESGYGSLKEALTTNTTVVRGPMRFVRRTPSRVQVSSRIIDPYRLAKEHASYPFRFAKQFTLAAPFIIIFAYHPWLGGLLMNENFADFTSIYTRALARRAFIQFLEDNSAVLNVTKAQASCLISGIGFLNISQLEIDSGNPDHTRFRLYTNPNALNPVPDLTIDYLQDSDPKAVQVERFVDDNY